VKDRQGKYLFVNKVAEQTVSTKAVDIVGKDNNSFFLPDDTETLREFDERVMQTKTSETIRIVANLGGVPRSFEIFKTPYFDEQGNVSGVTGKCRDITDDLRMEDELTQIWDNAIDLFSIAGTNGRFEKLNPAWSKCLGWSAEELLSRPWLDFVHPDDLDFTIEAGQKFIHGEPIIDFENRYRCRDGSYRWLSWHTVPRKMDAGGYCFARDVTESKQVEFALRHERDFLRQILDGLAGFVCVLRLDGVITEVNQLAFTSMNMSPQQIVGKKFSQIGWIHETSVTPVNLAIEAAARGEASHFEVHTVFPGVGFREVDGVFSPLRDVSGNVINVLAFGIDISDRKNLELRLQQSQKIEALGRLAGGVAHDFNNFLTVINGYGSIALAEVSPSSSMHEYLEAILQAGEGAADLTKQLLAFSRNAVVSLTNVDLNQIIKDTLKMIRRLIHEDIVLEDSYEVASVEIQGAKVQIEQVIINLVLNASDSIKKQGKIQVTSRRVSLTQRTNLEFPNLKSGEYAQLMVSDNGCGMSDDTKRKIFEPFFTTKEHGRGTGLGLSVVHGIVTQCGGAISVESQVNIGTTFKILFPIVQRPESTRQAVELEHNVHGIETVLLVEDESNVRKIVRISPESKGYRVLEASKASEALKVAAEHSQSIDLMLTDVVMPEVSGPELATMIRRLYPNISVIFMSGYNEDEVLRYGIVKNKEILFNKPLDFALLATRVREVLDQKRRR
jgi:two-component system, cell cycle sensor histidine kinase and response regulator CckA